MAIGEHAGAAHLEHAVSDLELRARLTPDYHMRYKRILLSDSYYPALAQSNVDVRTVGIDHAVPGGLVDADRIAHEVHAGRRKAANLASRVALTRARWAPADPALDASPCERGPRSECPPRHHPAGCALKVLQLLHERVNPCNELDRRRARPTTATRLFVRSTEWCFERPSRSRNFASRTRATWYVPGRLRVGTAIPGLHTPGAESRPQPADAVIIGPCARSRRFSMPLSA